MRIILVIVFIFSNQVFAGKIISIHGQAYGQLEGTNEYISLEKGIEVPYHTEIITKSKSFIKIKFENDSVFTLGPKSKMLLSKKDEKSPDILHLVTGEIKGIVKKDQNIPEGHEHKLYIKTRSAILGVRGTEFVVSYNNKNHNTSNITLEGQVDIYKKNDEEILESIREQYDTDKDKTAIKDYDETNDLKDQLSGYRVQSIKKGTFSSAMLSRDKALEPVRVSHQQINALKTSNLYSSKKKKVVNYKSINSKKIYLNKDMKRITKDGQRHGGFVDLKTGLYVAPPENALFDKESGVYEMPKELGGIDLSTGDYSPPKGIILDPTAGFVVDPLYYEDRDIIINLKKLTKLAGPIDKQLEQVVRIFKHITRSDFYGYGDSKHTSNIVENYYGEYRNITETPAFFLEGQGYGGLQLYHSKKYLLYLKGHFKGKYFDSDEGHVQRNNTVEGMGGIEFHRKFSVYGKKARLIFDSEFRKQYLNREMNGELLPYTDDISFRIKEVFSFNINNHSNFYLQLKYFQGFDENNHGKLHNMGFHHRFIWGERYDLLAGSDYSVRHDHINEQIYRITRLYAKAVRKDIFYKTDLTFGATHEWHESDIKFPFTKAIFKRAEFQLNRRLGSFWKLNANYIYEDQEAEQDLDNRSFNRHIFGLGLTMYF